MSQQTYKIIFMGTPDFAVPGLQALIGDSRFKIAAVITQEDKPVGRKQKLLPTPIKKVALENNLTVWQPKRLKNIADKIKAAAPDFIVVIAYGQILPEAVLTIPKIACINVHASLLPKYRGAACLQAPILNGDSETGVTVMLMDKGLDTGDILRQERIKLNGSETLAALHDELSALGAKILGNTLIDYAAGKIKPQLQNNKIASYITTIKKEDGRIDWLKPAEAIERQSRAFNPWPGTFTNLNGKIIKIIKAKAIENNDKNLISGQIFLEENGLAVKCGQNALLILELQLEGKKATDFKSFLAGHKEIIGQKFE